MRWLDQRFDFNYITIRPPFYTHWAVFVRAMRPFYLTAFLFWAAALRPK